MPVWEAVWRMLLLRSDASERGALVLEGGRGHLYVSCGHIAALVAPEACGPRWRRQGYAGESWHCAGFGRLVGFRSLASGYRNVPCSCVSVSKLRRG